MKATFILFAFLLNQIVIVNMCVYYQIGFETFMAASTLSVKNNMIGGGASQWLLRRRSVTAHYEQNFKISSKKYETFFP